VAILRARLPWTSFALTSVCSLAVLQAGWLPRWTSPGGSAFEGPAALSTAMLAFAVAVLVLFLNRALRYREPGGHIETVAAEILVVAYVGVLLTTTAQLRWVAGAQAGYLALGSLVVAAKAGDIGAYTLGRLLGRRKMMPRLSPGKTWMGAVGALLGAGLGAWAWLQFGTSLFDTSWQPCRWYWAILYGVTIGLAGLLGDLCESLIKRDFGVKDSAAFLPGFGGLLDLLDSILYAGPVAYLLWLWLPLVVRPL
jgi:phosphatidate cytidylyltransferase